MSSSEHFLSCCCCCRCVLCFIFFEWSYSSHMHCTRKMKSWISTNLQPMESKKSRRTRSSGSDYWLICQSRIKSFLLQKTPPSSKCELLENPACTEMKSRKTTFCTSPSPSPSPRPMRIEIYSSVCSSSAGTVAGVSPRCIMRRRELLDARRPTQHLRQKQSSLRPFPSFCFAFVFPSFRARCWIERIDSLDDARSYWPPPERAKGSGRDSGVKITPISVIEIRRPHGLASPKACHYSNHEVLAFLYPPSSAQSSAEAEDRIRLQANRKQSQ